MTRLDSLLIGPQGKAEYQKLKGKNMHDHKISREKQNCHGNVKSVKSSGQEAPCEAQLHEHSTDKEPLTLLWMRY